jgi:hypothetical protein
VLPPHSLATTYANNELFEMLRRGPQGIEYLRQSFALTRPEFEARRAAGLSIVVSPYATDPASYVITVNNNGSHTYRKLLVRYEALLLYAGNFGLDTTHMPDKEARKPGGPIEIAVVSPGESVQVVRTGYGLHDEYDGPHETAVDLEYRLESKTFATDDRRWCQVTVNLRNARSD